MECQRCDATVTPTDYNLIPLRQTNGQPRLWGGCFLCDHCVRATHGGHQR